MSSRARTRLIFIGAVLLLALAGWLYLRFYVSTDPNRLARSDPWLRQQLAQAEAKQNSSNPNQPSPTGSTTASPIR